MKYTRVSNDIAPALRQQEAAIQQFETHDPIIEFLLANKVVIDEGDAVFLEHSEPHHNIHRVDITIYNSAGKVKHRLEYRGERKVLTPDDIG